MSSEQRPRQQNSRNRPRYFHNSNESRNPSAASSWTVTSNRLNGNGNGNGRRAMDRDAPSTSRPVHSVNFVSLAPSQPQPPADDDDGWGQPDPMYFERKERREEAARRKARMMSEDVVVRTGRGQGSQQGRSQPVGQAALPLERTVEGRAAGRGPARRMTGRIAQGAMPTHGAVAQGAACYSGEVVEPQADWGYSQYENDGPRSDSFGGCSGLVEPQSETIYTHEFNGLSLQDSEDGTEDGNCSKDSGVYDWRREEELDERTEEAIVKVYSNDLLMETIISHITKLSDRSQVEMASTRMFNLSKKASYRFSEGGDHLHIHFTTFDDFATIQYGSVVRTVPILTMNTRRFDKMEPRMTIALHRILQNIRSRFARKVRKITLGGTTEFYSARGVPDHHLILTYDFLHYLLSTFSAVSSLHLVNCGLDDGAIDLCDSQLWRDAMARMESIELRTVWADTPNRLPNILNGVSCNLERFTLTRFTCKRMGAALLEQMRRANCRMKEVQLVIDEDSAE